MAKPVSTPVIVQSGEKYKTSEGFSAIRDGIKKSVQVTHGGNEAPYLRKPAWLRITYNSSPKYESVREIVREHRLSTVCEEAKCPNMSECWSHGTATIMLMGYVCTRACRFCSVDTGNPNGWLDKEEPMNTAKSVQLMGLKYVVLTSVDRDDLPDGGAQHYADTIKNIKLLSHETKVEALTGDFQGDLKDVQTVLDSEVDVFAQNVETVRRLTHPVRDPRASYEQTLAVLAFAKQYRPEVITKTSLMLGLGETEAEVIETMTDLRAIGVDVVTFGQYLQPTKNHLPIQRYVTPEEFERYRIIGLEKGFFEVASGPLVRSSYRADRIFEKNNLGMNE